MYKNAEVEYSGHPIRSIYKRCLWYTHCSHPATSIPPIIYIPPHPYSTLLNAGINVCASQKLKTSFGPVMSNFGVRPLKKLVKPSFFIMLLSIRKPLSGLSKFRFCIRVLMTSRGADTIREAEAPAMEATKFWPQEAVL
jgi:hypothetical protein